MKRASVAVLSVMILLAPAAASAKVVELGDQNKPLVAPSCPTSVKPKACTIILTEVTALETVTMGLAYPTTVTQPGQLVAFTVGLSKLSSNRKTARKEIHGLDATYGGVPEAAIVVLKPTGKKSLRKYKVIAQSPPVHLIPYLGQVAQFPLASSLTLKRGEVIGLAVPTWAPVLSINLSPKNYAYRQSRTGHCKAASTAGPEPLGTSTGYNCNYAGTRVEYAATEVTSPTPTKNYVHATDTGP